MSFGQRISAFARTQPLFVVGSLGAGFGLSFMSTQAFLQGRQDPTKLTVLSWNVLARPYTKYNRKFHRADSHIEEKSQTWQRYTLAGQEILSKNCDVVLLQEFEDLFVDAEWNSAANQLLGQYDLFRCNKQESPATAVMVRRGGRVTVTGPHICVGGGREFGGASKVATVVPIMANNRSILAMSGHFVWDGEPEKRLHHLETLGQTIQEKYTPSAAASAEGGSSSSTTSAGPPSIILGGDFNCDIGKNLEKLEESSTFLQSLQRSPLGENAKTGLSGDFSETVCIDHFYCSSDLLPSIRTVALARPASPWAGKMTRPAKVSGASDHVAILMELDLQPKPKPEPQEAAK